MSLILHPRVAPSDPAHRLRVWVGAFDRTTAPALTWKLDGQPSTPDAIRPIASVRKGSLLDGDPPRAFSGLYEFTNLQPDMTYRVTAKADQEEAGLTTWTLPAEVPFDLGESFNVLLVSCFHRDEDREGQAGEVVAALKAQWKPDLTLLMGDQVYLDLPTLQNFDDKLVWLADKFERDYMLNWRGPTGYAKVLAAAPSVSLPDDHEFWNNYPHSSPFIQNSHTDAGRDRWKRASIALYEGFQLNDPAMSGAPIRIDVPPLSFCLADTRTFRDDYPLRHSLDPKRGLDGFNEWVRHVRDDTYPNAERLDNKFFGVFVAGQSLLSPAAPGLKGSIGDRELANYDDFPQIIRGLEQLLQTGRAVLCITGDVHWGRVARGNNRDGRTVLYEVISSPSSLVTTVGADTFKKIGGFFGGLFGKRDPWPRHADAPDAPEFLAQDVLGRAIECKTIHTQKGNHVALLSFRKTGFGLELYITYFPIHSEIRQPVELKQIDLKPQ